MSTGADMGDPMGAMARRAEAEPFFLGHALARYRDARGLSDGDLARLLGCDAETLVRLKLCRRPEPETGDLGTIAAGVGVDASALARLLSPAG